MKRRAAMLVPAALAALAIPLAVQAQYPDRPIKMVVPFPAGGPTDGMARIVSDRLSTVLGQSVVVENKGGGGGVIGATEVARSAADGYTLLFGNTSTQVLNPAGMDRAPYDALKDFAPISIVAISTPSGSRIH